MTTFPINFPLSPGVVGVTLRPNNVIAISTSPWTGEQQVQQHQGQWWELEVDVPVLEQPESDSWTSFTTKMRGRLGTVYFADPSKTVAAGHAGVTATGSPVVFGAGQSGDVLVISNAVASVDNYLKAGDHIQVSSGSGSRLHMVLEDCSTVSGGVCSLEIWPDLRSSPTNAEAVVVASAHGVFRFVQNAQEWSIRPPVLHTVSYKLREAL